MTLSLMLYQWPILIYVSPNQTECLELHRHHEWENEPHIEQIRGPTIYSDRGTMGMGLKIKMGATRVKKGLRLKGQTKIKGKLEKRKEARHGGHTGHRERIDHWKAYTWSEPIRLVWWKCYSSLHAPPLFCGWTMHNYATLLLLL